MLKSSMLEIILTSGVFAALVSGIVAYIFKTLTEKKISILKAKLDKAVFVNKLQYEHEYGIYRDLWSALIDLRRATLQLRPILDTSGPEGKETERRKRLEAFGQNAETFRNIWEKNRPFYAISVYEKLDKLFNQCYEESIEYAYSEPFSQRSEYWKKAKENRDVIINDIDEVCNALRDRLNQLTVP